MNNKSADKKKVVVVRKMNNSMGSLNKQDEARKRYEEMKNSESKGLSSNEAEDISDSNMRSLYKKYELALNNLQSNCSNILYVESDTDKEVYDRFINKGITYIKTILPNNDLDNDDTKAVGNVGKNCSNKDAIMCLVARNAELKQKTKEDSPFYPRKTFYGIIDMDYDKDDREINILCKKIRTPCDICRKQLSTTTPANDIETLIFMFKENEILSLCSNNYVPYQCKEQILIFWKQLIEVAKQKAEKLGAMRKKSVTDFRKNELNENDKKNRYSLSFKNFFPIKCPEKYSEYVNNNEDEAFLLELVKKDIESSDKKADLKIVQDDYKRAINNRNVPFFEICRGHDLTGILSCLIKKEMMPKKSENEIEDIFVKDMIKLVTANDFDGAVFKKFIKQNML